MVTQATSPFFSKLAFLAILKTMRAAGLTAVAYHNHIPTLGEWGWVLGLKAAPANEAALQTALLAADFAAVPTKFLNRAAMVHMLHCGRGMLDQLDAVAVTNELDLSVYHYYRQGDWDIY